MLFVKPSMREAGEAAAAEPTTPAPPPPVQHSVVAVLAMKQVLDTPELCESILLYLDPKTLIRTRGLCRAVCNCVDKIPALQTKLWRKAAPATTPWALEDLGRTCVEGTDMLNRPIILTGKKALKYMEQATSTGNTPPRSALVHVSNDLLLTENYDGEGLALRLAPHCIHTRSPGHGFCASILMPLEGLLALPISASCRAMYLTQPPVTQARIEKMVAVIAGLGKAVVGR